MNPKTLVKFLSEVRSQIDPEMSVQKLQVLALCLSAPDGIDQQTIFNTVDQSRSAVSKNIADLTALTSKKQPGPGLLRSESDPMNLTVRRITVTPKGRKVWESVQSKSGA